MCLAQGHNSATLVKLDPGAPPSQVKLSTTESCAPPILLIQREGHALPNAQRAYILYKVSKPAPGPEVTEHLLVLTSTEH